jgi:6-phosphofructokinase 1
MSHPLDFVTVEGLLAYGRALARRASERGLVQPLLKEVSGDDLDRVQAKMEQIRSFIERSKAGFATAEAYQSARESLIDDQLVFFAAWNALLAEGSLQPLLRATIGLVAKPTYRRPVAIVPRAQLTPTLAEGRIVLELGDDRFWLLPRDLGDRTLFFTMRHGVSQVDSKTHRVGCRLPNQLDRERGVAKADAVGAALARMIGVVGQQLDFLHLANYLDPRTFLHCISRSPNTKQLYERVSAALLQGASASEPIAEPALESSDFGWVTGLEKSLEIEEAARAFSVETSPKR